jgi:hypothetical protein
MLKRFIILAVILLNSIPIFANEIKKEEDSTGRVVKISHYKDNQLIETEEYIYTDASDKPDRIIYRQKQGIDFTPYKELQYEYIDNKTASIGFARFINDKKIEEGKITFTYKEGKLTFTRYFIRLKPSGRLFMFALQQHLYSEDSLTTRRFVQYEINPDTLKPMQSSQHVFFYKDSVPESMKAWILEESSQKIIENTEKDVTIIEKIIEDIEKKCIYRSSGNTFNRI